MLKIYVDTSIAWSHPSDGIVGILICKDGFEPRKIFGFVKKCSETQAILIGMAKALGYVQQLDEAIEFNLSCGFVVNALTNGWLVCWEGQHYLKSNKKIVKNAREWHDLYLALKGKYYKTYLRSSAELKDECLARAKKHESIFQTVQKSSKKI